MFYVKKYSPKQSDQVFYFEQPTNVSFGGGGLAPDPYETKFLQLQESLVPNSGDGVVARLDVPKNTIVAHYSLHLYKGICFKTVYNKGLVGYLCQIAAVLSSGRQIQ